MTLRIEVDEVGAVRAVAVAASSGHPSLDAAAVDAARGWRFTPARRGGVPVASAVLRRVRFVLDA
ncbi:MAG: TonB family protein [Planctomycetota bacterium]